MFYNDNFHWHNKILNYGIVMKEIWWYCDDYCLEINENDYTCYRILIGQCGCNWWQVMLFIVLTMKMHYVVSMSSSSSELDACRRMERLCITLIWGLPWSFLRKVSLYLTGMWGHSCLLLNVDIADWPLVLAASGSESEVLSEEELGSCVEIVDVGEEGSSGVVLRSLVGVCEVSWRETNAQATYLSIFLLVMEVLKWD